MNKNKELLRSAILIDFLSINGTDKSSKNRQNFYSKSSTLILFFFCLDNGEHHKHWRIKMVHVVKGTVVAQRKHSSDKGVPMIKAEAARIVAKQGKGKKKQKKKEALVGVKYDVNANVRTAKEVADNLVYLIKKKPAKAQNIR